MLSPVGSGLPRKVRQKALELGVHHDCLVSSNPCAACRTRVYIVMDQYYGHDGLTPGQLFGRVLDDSAEDEA